jgi:RecJ-like exonuclease
LTDLVTEKCCFCGGDGVYKQSSEAGRCPPCDGTGKITFDRLEKIAALELQIDSLRHRIEVNQERLSGLKEGTGEYEAVSTYLERDGFRVKWNQEHLEKVRAAIER